MCLKKLNVQVSTCCVKSWSGNWTSTSASVIFNQCAIQWKIATSCILIFLCKGAFSLLSAKAEQVVIVPLTTVATNHLTMCVVNGRIAWGGKTLLLRFLPFNRVNSGLFLCSLDLSVLIFLFDCLVLNFTTGFCSLELFSVEWKRFSARMLFKCNLLLSAGVLQTSLKCEECACLEEFE